MMPDKTIGSAFPDIILQYTCENIQDLLNLNRLISLICQIISFPCFAGHITHLLKPLSHKIKNLIFYLKLFKLLLAPHIL